MRVVITIRSVPVDLRACAFFPRPRGSVSPQSTDMRSRGRGEPAATLN